MLARPIFIGGTASHVGKSWVATALCRYLYRMGYRVAPFKAQNMSNNSMACAGGEIGRAQAAQAEACGIVPQTDMNPILLKPTGTLGSQVVLKGQPWKTLKPVEYYEHFDFLLEQVWASYARLARQYEFVIVEGAGSITELNLKQRDLVNLGLAARLAAPCILVADIDRGGVFASVVGTFQLLDETESLLVRSFLVNKFRGDPALFQDGVRILEEKTGRPCLGVFPFSEEISLDPEDSLSLEDGTVRSAAASQQFMASSSVAIVRFPHISNFTDFRLLRDAIYVSSPAEKKFDVVILPGTKSTIEDLLWLRATGLETWLFDQIRHGARVIGICGGYQMLGEEIVDPYGVESPVRAVRGLGLLRARTHLSQTKITRPVSATTPSGTRFEAYEIHMGLTIVDGNYPPFADLDEGVPDGVRAGQTIGTYLHGALENKRVLEELLGHPLPFETASSKDGEYDRLADWFSQHVNQDVLFTEYISTEKRYQVSS